MANIPQIAPLLLLSEYCEWTSKDLTNNAAGYRNAIGRASKYLSRICQRRFDEQIDTRFFTAKSTSFGGHIRNENKLLLGDDLRSLTTLTEAIDPYTPGSGTAITSGYQLLRDDQQFNVVAYSAIQRNTSWLLATTTPVNSISVAGLWGYGGQWVATGATVSADSGTSMTVSDGTKLEIGMVVKMDSEYRYVSAIATNTITTTPAFNGSTQATHSNGVVIYRWQPLEEVQELIIRLIQWRAEQIKAPLFGQVTVGDITFPVDTQGVPKDVLDTIRRAGLSRVQTKVRAI